MAGNSRRVEALIEDARLRLERFRAEFEGESSALEGMRRDYLKRMTGIDGDIDRLKREIDDASDKLQASRACRDETRRDPRQKDLPMYQKATALSIVLYICAVTLLFILVRYPLGEILDVLRGVPDISDGTHMGARQGLPIIVPEAILSALISLGFGWGGHWVLVRHPRWWVRVWKMLITLLFLMGMEIMGIPVFRDLGPLFRLPASLINLLFGNASSNEVYGYTVFTLAIAAAFMGSRLRHITILPIYVLLRRKWPKSPEIPRLERLIEDKKSKMWNLEAERLRDPGGGRAEAQVRARFRGLCEHILENLLVELRAADRVVTSASASWIQGIIHELRDRYDCDPLF